MKEHRIQMVLTKMQTNESIKHVHYICHMCSSALIEYDDCIAGLLFAYAHSIRQRLLTLLSTTRTKEFYSIRHKPRQHSQQLKFIDQNHIEIGIFFFVVQLRSLIFLFVWHVFLCAPCCCVSVRQKKYWAINRSIEHEQRIPCAVIMMSS